MYKLRKLEQQDGGWWSIVVVSPEGIAIAWREWCPDQETMHFRIAEKVKNMNREIDAARGKSGKKTPGWKQQRDDGTNQTYSEKGNRNRDNKQREVYKSRVRAYFEEHKAARAAGRM